jgi:ferritin-like metal-binding protein YciE
MDELEKVISGFHSEVMSDFKNEDLAQAIRAWHNKETEKLQARIKELEEVLDLIGTKELNGISQFNYQERVTNIQKIIEQALKGEEK